MEMATRHFLCNLAQTGLLQLDEPHFGGRIQNLGETPMTTPTYDPKITAVLLVDPYNDFLSEGGKLWPRAKPIAEEVDLLDNLRA